MVKLMNQVGFTHACLGNHEFDMSVKTLVDRLSEMTFKVVNSNIKPLKKTIPHDVVEVNLGTTDSPDLFRIGFLGFCTEKTKRLCNNVPYDVTISKIDQAAPKAISELRGELHCDFIIAMTHQDAKYDEKMASELDVNLVIGGHDHVKIIERKTNHKYGRDNWLIKCGMDASTVGVTTINIRRSDGSAPALSKMPPSPSQSIYDWFQESGLPSAPASPQPGPSRRQPPLVPLSSPTRRPQTIEEDFESSFDSVLIESDTSPSEQRHRLTEGADESDPVSYSCGRHGVSILVHTVEIANPTLPFDPLVDVMIDHANSIVKHVESQYLVKEPLLNKGVRDHETPFATYLLSRVRDWNHVDCVLAPAGIFRGKTDYANGFRISDLHNELKWDEFLLLKLPADVLGAVVSFSRSQGGDFRGFLQKDDKLILSQQSEKVWSVVQVNGKPVEATKKYFVLIARSTKVDTNTKLFNPVVSNYIKHVRAAVPLRRRHSMSYVDSSASSTQTSNQLTPSQEENLRRDIHHHHHERPTVVETVIASLITEHWKTLFGPMSSTDDSVYFNKTDALEQLKDESLVNAVFHALGARDGRIHKDEFRRALRTAHSLPSWPRPAFLDSEDVEDDS